MGKICGGNKKMADELEHDSSLWNVNEFCVAVLLGVQGRLISVVALYGHAPPVEFRDHLADGAGVICPIRRGLRRGGMVRPMLVCLGDALIAVEPVGHGD